MESTLRMVTKENTELILASTQAGIDRHIEWPETVMAVLAAVLLSAGVLRHYWDIYIHRTVRGISFVFVSIDAAGDLFSLVSICTFHLCLRDMASVCSCT